MTDEEMWAVVEIPNALLIPVETLKEFLDTFQKSAQVRTSYSEGVDFANLLPAKASISFHSAKDIELSIAKKALLDPDEEP